MGRALNLLLQPTKTTVIPLATVGTARHALIFRRQLVAAKAIREQGLQNGLRQELQAVCAFEPLPNDAWFTARARMAVQWVFFQALLLLQLLQHVMLVANCSEHANKLLNCFDAKCKMAAQSHHTFDLGNSDLISRHHPKWETYFFFFFWGGGRAVHQMQGHFTQVKSVWPPWRPGANLGGNWSLENILPYLKWQLLPWEVRAIFWRGRTGRRQRSASCCGGRIPTRCFACFRT